MKEKIESIISQLNDLLSDDDSGYILIAYKNDESCISSVNDVSSYNLTELFYNLIVHHQQSGGDLMFMGSMFDASLNYAQRNEPVIKEIMCAFVRWLKEVSPQNVHILGDQGKFKCNGDA